MTTTFEFSHQSALGYESTQFVSPSKSVIFVRHAREHFLKVFAFFTCGRVVLAELDTVVQQVNTIVECDVGSLADEIANVTQQLAEFRVAALGGLSIAERAAEVLVTRRESQQMLLEDRDVAVVFTPFELTEPAIIASMAEHIQIIEGTAPAVFDAGGIVAEEEFRDQMEAHFERTYNTTYDEVATIAEAHAREVARLYQPVVQPDGTVAIIRSQPTLVEWVLRRSGATRSLPGWTQEQQDALELKERNVLVPRKLFPRLVAASVHDARSRWGLLPDTQANRLMVGHHMRKQLNNGELRKSTVDMNVSIALNLFFVPHAGDLIARGQAIHWRVAEQWRAYDLQGLSWWQRLTYNGHRVATPVV